MFFYKLFLPPLLHATRKISSCHHRHHYARNPFLQYFLPQQQQKQRGKIYHDVTVVFIDPVEGATQLAQQLHTHDNISTQQANKALSDNENDVIYHLTDFLSYYQSIILSSPQFSQRRRKEEEVKFKARIVASQGPIGTKCPRWHVDHVPLRLVASLLGPGCSYIPQSQKQNVCIDYNFLNNCDVDDTAMANNRIVQFAKGNEERKEGIFQAQENEAILLMGREWEEAVRDDQEKLNDRHEIKAAVHKSPELRMDENRVLLTVDIVPDEV
mmetsp:Transcript_3886/g.5993  ORF Transcript_3886/g.5993 Transcript_3886/m.5993 type:complete len:270 (-) Transcript_3886:291-1100(-)